MGSTDDPNNKGIDASVGGLVWVRRRNGSWWPGRILSVDELSESCLVSPRSGTPVKLLGRDDASVDWYNLEKSKRVKAFRCGEYDDCIERAKAAANSNKKAVKYARREDAILHALEIESIRLGKDPPEFFHRGRDGSISELGSPPRDSPTSSHSSEENEEMTDGLSGSEDNLDSVPGYSHSGKLFEEPNQTTASKMQSKQGRRRRTPYDSEDEGTEGIKRMRGLEDLGMCVGSKGKAQGGGVLDLAQEDSAALCDSNNVNCMSNGSPVNGNKVYTSLKRKRSQVANFHETLKRKNRRRALTQVLESVVSVPVSVTDQLASSNCLPHQGLIDGKVSAIDSNDSRKNIYVEDNNISNSTGVSCENSVFLNGSEHLYDASNINSKVNDSEIPTKSGLAENNSSDNLFEVPFVGGGKQSAGLSSTLVTCSYGKPHGFLGRPAENSSLKVGRLNESGSTSSEAVHISTCSPKVESGTSKWKLKGKRNSRQKSKNRKQSSRKYANMDNEPNDDSGGLETMNGFLQGCKEGDCNDVGGALVSYSRSNQAKLVTVDNADGLKEWEKFTPHKGGHTRGPKADKKLFPDGSLTTQRSLPYRQSRFTVNPKYGLSDFPARTSALYDVKLEVKANYRPQHVPLVSLMSKSQAIVGHPVTVEVLGDGEVDKANCNTTDVSIFPVDIIDSVKPISDGVRNPKKRLKVRSRLSSRKSSKTKKPASLSKKIRKLSSLTVQKPNEEKKVMMEQHKEPVVACIPLKVVISRISEAVNGSTRPPHPHRATPSKNS